MHGRCSRDSHEEPQRVVSVPIEGLLAQGDAGRQRLAEQAAADQRELQPLPVVEQIGGPVELNVQPEHRACDEEMLGGFERVAEAIFTYP